MMNRNELINKAFYPTLAERYSYADGYEDGYEQCRKDIEESGAKWQLDKAVEWLTENNNLQFNQVYKFHDFIVEFKKVMERV